MPWPWVSRKRLEDAERRLVESEAERKDLMERLIARREVASTVQPIDTETKQDSAPYTTPHDNVIRRFQAAGTSARKPQFKARMH